jgi:D-alanine-D-alanine ligase-like ATP-grasp enzyme/acylphosphatase
MADDKPGLLKVDHFEFDKSQPYYRLLGNNVILLRRALRQKNVVISFFPERNDKKAHWVARGTNKVIYFRHTMTASTLRFRGITNNKHRTKTILREAGVRVPSGVMLERESHEQAMSWFDELKSKKAVVKPIIGSGGEGITSAIQSRERFREAYASVASRKVVLEEHIDGDDHRILVLGGRVIAAMRRWPAHVTGDGEKNIEQLVQEKNTQRKKNPYDYRHLLEINAKAHEVLLTQGLTPESVPERGRKAFLQTVANIGAGGDGEDMTSLIHSDFISIAEKCAAAFDGIECMGVDLIAKDISRPAAEQSHAVIEINANCDIPIHHWPAKGQPLDVASKIADYYFPDDAKDSSRSIRAEIRGRVKNVGYLRWLSRQALLHGINGYCRNIGDDAVELVAEGANNAVESLLSLCASGPEKSRIRSVNFEPAPHDNFTTFRIL